MTERRQPDSSLPARVDSIRAGLLCRCPRCGQGKLFAGFLKVVERCAVCGTDFTRLNTGDGAAVFIMQISGGISTFLALAIQIAFQPPLWVLLGLAVPLVLALSFGLMRPGKGLMIALQMRHARTAEGPHV
ncbi:DUF983 domain-containing protein [Brevundimonas sp. A19_0]|nr:DUF983 domain-containing protein [Brevundimonas sp. A19_0]